MIIETQQGRTVDLIFSIQYEDGQPYLLQQGDVIRFGVKSAAESNNYIIFKTLTMADEENGKYPLTLTPEDTNIPAKRYFYDASLELADGSCCDIEELDRFTVKFSVTRKGDS